MPHEKVRINEEKFKELHGKIFKENASVVVVKGIYKSTSNDAYLIKVISSDKDFQQHYYLVAYPEEDRNSNWIIKLDSSSNPYRTPAVKFSVKAIAEFLEGN
ncbi:MAG TPA: tRNA (guanosine(46)-N7)-methyltransferase TrmB, partial [Fervidobacterium nodosum]|nr:tRNA (guanosine(46)-N7)-methyltransferase TrmB [Fervidobacterium nodosum]